MEYVKCWCCEHYDIFDEKALSMPEFYAAICNITDTLAYAQSDVCPEFILRQGLHTNRLIPDYCKNYKKTED